MWCSEPSDVMMTGTGRGTATPTEGGEGARSQAEGDKENAAADENQRTRRHSRSGSVTSSKPQIPELSKPHIPELLWSGRCPPGSPLSGKAGRLVIP